MRIKRYFVVLSLVLFGWLLEAKTNPFAVIGKALQGVTTKALTVTSVAAAQANAQKTAPAGSIALGTEDYNTYGWKNISSESMIFVLKFDAKATSGIHVALKYGTNSYVEIPIGGWNNTKSVVRFFENGSQKGGDVEVTGPAKPIPDTTNFVTYTLALVQTRLTVFSQLASGEQALVFQVTIPDLARNYSAYSFRCWTTSIWYVKSASTTLDRLHPAHMEAQAIVNGAVRNTGLTTLLAKLQAIENTLNGTALDANLYTNVVVLSQELRFLLSSLKVRELSPSELNVLQSIVVQGYYLSTKLADADQPFLDNKKGLLEDTWNTYRALGFLRNSLWEWQIENICLILRKIASDAKIPAAAAATVSCMGVFLARALMAQAPASSAVTTQELNDYYKPGVTVSPALASKYLAAYYAGYLASSFATKNAIRDLTGCLIKIRGLITGVDSNNYPSLTPYEGAFNYVSKEADIPVDPRQAYFSTKDIPVIAGGSDPLLCVLRVNGRYLQFTGTAERPSWGVAQSAATATQFKLVLMPAAATWTTDSLVVELLMLLPSGEVPLRCVSVSRAAQFGLPATDSPLRPAKAGTGSDSMTLKLVNPRYWLTGAASQPTIQLNGVEVPKSSWLYELDGLHKDHSLFAAADLAKNQFFTTTTKGVTAPAGYVEAHFSFEALPPVNTIKTAFLSIPPLESYIRTAKIDAVLDEMLRVAHSANPSEADSFKFARSGEILGKNFHALTVKQQTKLLSSVLA